jgi:hypothetical protein
MDLPIFLKFLSRAVTMPVSATFPTLNCITFLGHLIRAYLSFVLLHNVVFIKVVYVEDCLTHYQPLEAANHSPTYIV